MSSWPINYWWSGNPGLSHQRQTQGLQWKTSGGSDPRNCWRWIEISIKIETDRYVLWSISDQVVAYILAFLIILCGSIASKGTLVFMLKQVVVFSFSLYVCIIQISCVKKISSLLSSRSLLFKQIFRSAIRKQKAPNGCLTPLEETLRWSFVRFYILHAIHDLTPKGELRLRCYSYNLWDTPGKSKH